MFSKAFPVFPVQLIAGSRTGLAVEEKSLGVAWVLKGAVPRGRASTGGLLACNWLLHRITKNSNSLPRIVSCYNNAH